MCSVSASPMDLALKPDSISPGVASRAPMSPPRPATDSSRAEVLPMMFSPARRTRETPRTAVFVGTAMDTAVGLRAAGARGAAGKGGNVDVSAGVQRGGEWRIGNRRRSRMETLSERDIRNPGTMRAGGAPVTGA